MPQEVQRGVYLKSVLNTCEEFHAWYFQGNPVVLYIYNKRNLKAWGEKLSCMRAHSRSMWLVVHGRKKVSICFLHSFLIFLPDGLTGQSVRICFIHEPRLSSLNRSSILTICHSPQGQAGPNHAVNMKVVFNSAPSLLLSWGVESNTNWISAFKNGNLLS